MKNLLFLGLILFTVSSAWAKQHPVDFNLSLFKEEAFLRQKPALLALSDFNHPVVESKIPLILVHGINGNPSDMQDIVNRYKDSHYQLYILAYDDYYRRASLNGADFGILLQEFTGKSSEIVIVAHSMGAIVTRKALADLVRKPEMLAQFEKIKFFSVDTPWHGFNGPSDNDPRLNLVRPFMPDGLEDMRARSAMFKDLNSVTFPSKIVVDIAFAEEGDQAWDYTEAEQKFNLPEQFINFESALRLSSNLHADPAKVPYSSLAKFFPRFPGDHVTVVKEHEGTYSYLDYLQQNLN